jgi:PAS domain S-box-containing protein
VLDVVVRRTAVIVDDNEEVARALGRILASFGYTVIGIAHGPEVALRMVRTECPDVLIIDVDLHHRLSGIDVAAQLVANGDNLPIVFLTATEEPDMTQLAGRDGVFGFLAKPITATALRTTIELLRMQHTARLRLLELERHYHALFDQAAVGVAELDAASGRLVEVNRKCAEIFACSVDELVGSDLVERAEPARRETFRAALQDLTRGAVHEHVVELACRRGDAGTVWVRVTAAPLETPKRQVVIVEDITARRLAEGQLHRHRYLLAESQRIAAIGSFHLEYTTGAITWTDEMYRLHGASPGHFVPTVATILPLIHPDDRSKVAEALRPPSPGDPPRADFDFAVVLGDGTVRKLRNHGELVIENDGKVAMIGTVHDVTERERVMSASRESAERERVALAANRAKTEFLTHMSHELRTPLNAVLGLSEALLESIFGELNEGQAHSLATIHTSGRHLLDLINDVLDIARLEAGKLPIESEQVPLRSLIDDGTALVHGQLTAKAQRLVIELAPALSPVDVDRRRIKQVLVNLLGNASKFSPPGATVTLRAENRPETRQVEISVMDNGPGIAAADRARIFEPFVTLDPSLSRSHDGAGLGLALTKRIVEAHGGSIHVESEIARGATFTITLPVSLAYVGEPRVTTRPLPRRAPRVAAVEPRRTILLAEDNEATVFTVRSYLENHGYTVRVVRDGPAALEAATARDIAMLLVDIQLPGLDGLEVTRQLRARRDGADRPIIALTAHAMPGDEGRCLAAGASAYLAKPVRLRELTETIGRLLENR